MCEAHRIRMKIGGKIEIIENLFKQTLDSIVVFWRVGLLCFFGNFMHSHV